MRRRVLLVKGLIEHSDERKAGFGVEQAKQARDTVQAMRRDARLGTVRRPERVPLAADVLRSGIWLGHTKIFWLASLGSGGTPPLTDRVYPNGNVILLHAQTGRSQMLPLCG